MTDGDLKDFFEAAGRSLADAQGQLAGKAGVDTTLAISDAELEVKAALESTSTGLRLSTISAEQARRGVVEPGALSSIKIRFVALAEPAPAARVRPVLTEQEVVGVVDTRPDLKGIRDVFGRFLIDPVFVPEGRRWLVTVREPEGHVLRELVLPDEVVPEKPEPKPQ